MLEGLLTLALMVACAVAGLASAGLTVWMLVSSVRRKGKMGINVRREDCPRCSMVLPMVRKPANLRQVMWGGWTCQGCGAELDKWGQELG